MFAYAGADCVIRHVVTSLIQAPQWSSYPFTIICTSISDGVISILLFPLCWEWTAAGVAWYGSTQNNTRVTCSQWFTLKSQDGYVWWEEPRLRKVWWDSLGSWYPGCCCSWTRLWPPAWEIHASLQSMWGGPCKRSAPFALWKPPISSVEHEQPMHRSAHTGTLLQRLLVCWLLTVPDIPDLLQWNFCSSLLQKGVTFCYFPV